MAFPTSISSLARPTPTTKRNAGSGLALSTVIDAISDDLEAVEAVLGAGITSSLGVMRKIAEVSGNSSSGVLEFTSIPATYRALQLSIYGRSTAAGTTGIAMQVTLEASPTAGAYDDERIVATTTTVASAENLGGQNFFNFGFVPADGATANVFAAHRIFIHEYAQTVGFKVLQHESGTIVDLTTGNIQVRNSTGLWESTAAIDRIKLTLASGNWKTGSRATLWGVPG